MKQIPLQSIDATSINRWEVSFRYEGPNGFTALAIPVHNESPARGAIIILPRDEELVGYDDAELERIILVYAQIAADRVAKLLPAGVELRDSVSVVR